MADLESKESSGDRRNYLAGLIEKLNSRKTALKSSAGDIHTTGC